jgi:hypothetical protein
MLLIPRDPGVHTGGGDGQQPHLGFNLVTDFLQVGGHRGEELHAHVPGPDLGVAGAVARTVAALEARERSAAVPTALELRVWVASLAGHRVGADS